MKGLSEMPVAAEIMSSMALSNQAAGMKMPTARMVPGMA